MNLQPLADRIIVKPLEAQDITKGGIVLPDTAKEKPQEGKVIAVGKGRRDEKGQFHAVELKAGDVILYGKYSGSEIKDKKGEAYLIMREEDVLAIVK